MEGSTLQPCWRLLEKDGVLKHHPDVMPQSLRLNAGEPALISLDQRGRWGIREERANRHRRVNRQPPVTQSKTCSRCVCVCVCARADLSPTGASPRARPCSGDGIKMGLKTTDVFCRATRWLVNGR